ncbi:MAG TPA: FAD:protein FMN transferase [Candidatus Lustribacter sp.]|nr:FAD:protein FMN transferase [Candidatus Lustribacter sp.]
MSRWAALGTYVYLAVGDPTASDSAQALARDVLAEVDLSCSRFRDDSDLVRANAQAGRWVDVSPVLAGAVVVALEAARETGGLVDPTLGLLLRDAGYDRTFALLGGATDEPAALPTMSRPQAWRDVEVDPGGRLCVPTGVALDLGATGKAYAADLVAATVVERLRIPTVVSIGGDVRVEAPSGDDRDWPIEIAETAADLTGRATGRDPGTDPPVVLLRSGGLATSTVRARRWVRGGRHWHHVFDPRTGTPAAGPWRTITAAGHTCSAANTATTAALVGGDDALAWLEARAVAARLVGTDGTVHVTPGWPDSRESSQTASLPLEIR